MDLLERDVRHIEVLEQTRAPAQYHRHDIDVELVNQLGVEKLLLHVGTH